MRYLSVFVYGAYFAFVVVLADGDDVVFRDTRNRNQGQQQPGFTKAIEPSQTFRVPKSIPLELIQQLNEIANEEDFIKKFVAIEPVRSVSPSASVSRVSPDRNKSVYKRPTRLTDARHLPRDTEIEPIQIASAYSLSGASPGNRFGDGVVDTRLGIEQNSQIDRRNAAPTPKPAHCQPELRTVNLRDTNDPTLYYFPSCTRVDRCGGCCASDLLSCQPIATDYKNFSVMVSQYHGGDRLEQRGRKVVTVETHTKCKCDCRVKERDCTSLQEYNKKDCRCVCRNKQDEIGCSKDKTRIWDSPTCSCRCKEVQDCSTGLSFDEATCSCQPYSKSFPPDYNLDRIDRTKYQISYPEH